VEIKITENGEVLFRSPGVFLEYYKNPEATTSTKTTDGWVKTGDAGFFDDRGHLKIIDRAKDVGHLNDGSLFAPKYIENKLKFFPNIREAVAFGHQRDEKLSGSQIRRFLVLHKELDADDGELTRTRKVRRGFIADRYQLLIEALYSDLDEVHVETEVTFEDGRKGKISADLKVVDAEVVESREPLKMAG
jgi:long-chain acyl-CoA synthetase